MIVTCFSTEILRSYSSVLLIHSPPPLPLQIYMQAQFVRAEKNVKELNLSVDLMKKESKKLLERAALAEKDLNYGHTELM